MAKDGRAVCGAVHGPRLNGTEMFDTAIGFLNADLEHSVAITRLTIRNAWGDIVHDSGPAVSVPHPLNTDTVPALDITTIAPGATHYLTTTNIWGNFPVPDPVLGRVGGGSSMSVNVEFFTDGKSEFVITTGLRVRERIQVSPGVFVQGQEKARTSRLCDQLK